MSGQRSRHKDPSVDNDFRSAFEGINGLTPRTGDLKLFFFSNGVANSSELDTPKNWLICNGKEVSCSEYPELFSILGFRYGSGVDSKVFALPTLTALDTYFGWIIKGK